MKTREERKNERLQNERIETYNDILKDTNLSVQAGAKNDKTPTAHLLIGVIVATLLSLLSYLNIFSYITGYYIMILFCIFWIGSGIYLILRKRYYE